ncbi:uncharacterized protein LOC121730601 [Aricia agestis]|uniref:uncharacterized protein LOC121730601 n=1 Tax=Aricia agestis TaxID=91739 RepID=UPI001C2063F8|nr:uncharacterized protein LOC121730601 [Aricia agestis]
MWLPYTCMFLAERSRPFYGSSVKKSPLKQEKGEKPTPKKRKIKEDYVLPINVKPLKSKEADLNVSLEIRHMPKKQGKYENAFNEFLRRGKEQLFDEFYFNFCRNVDINDDSLYYLRNVDASTEDKFYMVIENIVSDKEIDNFLRQCWRYNFLYKQPEIKDSSESTVSLICKKLPITIHAPWCLVCGDKEKLWECTNCPASFHIACRKEWLVSIIHRKNPPKKINKKTTLIQKILSSTRTIKTVQKDSDKENYNLCPSCMWGPKVGYDDIVWHKLGSCPWWPARILTPGELPSCLLSRSHSPHQWPLKYYGALNYSWGDTNRMCLFLPKHLGALQAKDEMLRQAVLDACDDYIAVYLT